MSGRLTATVYNYTYVGTVVPPNSGYQVGFELEMQGAGSPYGSLNILQFVQYNPSAGGNMPVGAACKMIGQYVVDQTAAQGDICIGCNDVSGAVIPPGSYFWMNKIGLQKPLVAASVAAKTVLSASNTAGTLAAWQSGLSVPQQSNIISLAASGGGGGQTLSYVKD